MCFVVKRHMHLPDSCTYNLVEDRQPTTSIILLRGANALGGQNDPGMAAVDKRKGILVRARLRPSVSVLGSLDRSG